MSSQCSLKIAALLVNCKDLSRGLHTGTLGSSYAPPTFLTLDTALTSLAPLFTLLLVEQKEVMNHFTGLHKNFKTNIYMDLGDPWLGGFTKGASTSKVQIHTEVVQGVQGLAFPKRLLK